MYIRVATLVYTFVGFGPYAPIDFIQASLGQSIVKVCYNNDTVEY